MILSDFDLKNYISSGKLGIEPFDESIVRENGLDLRIGKRIARFKKINTVIDVRLRSMEEFYVFEDVDNFALWLNSLGLLFSLCFSLTSSTVSSSLLYSYLYSFL